MTKACYPASAVIPASTVVGAGAVIGERVIMAGDGIVVQNNARLDAASVIGEGVTVGQGAWVRAGAVVLSSVPANAIVEGNPAHVVGYRSDLVNNQRPDPRHIEVGAFDHLERPAKVDLGVGSSVLYLMRRHTDTRGSLTVGEVPSEIPFSPARYFVVYDVPSAELRGEHAHRKCQQFLTCLHGSCRVLLDDGQTRCEVTLDRPDVAIFMPEMIWGTQYRYSNDAVLMVFASRPYEAEDYVRTYGEFIVELGLDQ